MSQWRHYVNLAFHILLLLAAPSPLKRAQLAPARNKRQGGGSGLRPAAEGGVIRAPGSSTVGV
jgi:hypothetical protein